MKEVLDRAQGKAQFILDLKKNHDLTPAALIYKFDSKKILELFTAVCNKRFTQRLANDAIEGASTIWRLEKLVRLY